jgi:hypothetical protein
MTLTQPIMTESYPLINVERSLKLAFSRMRAPQHIIMIVLTLASIYDTNTGGKSIFMNCGYGEHDGEHVSGSDTHFCHRGANIGSCVQISHVVMRVVGDNDDDPTKTMPADTMSISSVQTISSHLSKFLIKSVASLTYFMASLSVVRSKMTSLYKKDSAGRNSVNNSADIRAVPLGINGGEDEVKEK